MVGLAPAQRLRCPAGRWRRAAGVDRGQDGPCAQLSPLRDGSSSHSGAESSGRPRLRVRGSAAAAGLQFLRGSAGASVG